MKWRCITKAPFQIHSITDKFKPFQSRSVLTSALCYASALYEGRVIFTVDGLTYGVLKISEFAIHNLHQLELTFKFQVCKKI